MRLCDNAYEIVAQENLVGYFILWLLSLLNDFCRPLFNTAMKEFSNFERFPLSYNVL